MLDVISPDEYVVSIAVPFALNLTRFLPNAVVFAISISMIDVSFVSDDGFPSAVSVMIDVTLKLFPVVIHVGVVCDEILW